MKKPSPTILTCLRQAQIDAHEVWDPVPPSPQQHRVPPRRQSARSLPSKPILKCLSPPPRRGTSRTAPSPRRRCTTPAQKISQRLRPGDSLENPRPRGCRRRSRSNLWTRHSRTAYSSRGHACLPQTPRRSRPPPPPRPPLRPPIRPPCPRLDQRMRRTSTPNPAASASAPTTHPPAAHPSNASREQHRR